MRKENAHHLAKEGWEERNRRVTNGQTSIHQVAIKTTSDKEGVRYVHSLSEDYTGWERKRAWGKARARGGGGSGSIFLWVLILFFLFLKFFSFRDSGRDIFAFHAEIIKKKKKNF